MKIICINCRYFKQTNKGNAIGECYRYPPTMTIIADKEQLLGFSRISGMPEVGANDFCGEFEKEETHERPKNGTNPDSI